MRGADSNSSTVVARSCLFLKGKQIDPALVGGNAECGTVFEGTASAELVKPLRIMPSGKPPPMAGRMHLWSEGRPGDEGLFEIQDDIARSIASR